MSKPAIIILGQDDPHRDREWCTLLCLAQDLEPAAALQDTGSGIDNIDLLNMMDDCLCETIVVVDPTILALGPNPLLRIASPPTAGASIQRWAAMSPQPSSHRQDLLR